MSDRNECTPGDAANAAARAAERAAAEALLVATVAAVEAAAVDGLVNIQMTKGPWPLVDPCVDNTSPEAHPPTVNGRYSTPGPVVQANIQQAVTAIIRGDATLV